MRLQLFWIVQFCISALHKSDSSVGLPTTTVEMPCSGLGLYCGHGSKFPMVIRVIILFMIYFCEVAALFFDSLINPNNFIQWPCEVVIVILYYYCSPMNSIQEEISTVARYNVVFLKR